MFFIIPWELKHSSGKSTVPAANVMLIAVNVLLYLVGYSWVVAGGTSWSSVLLYGFSHCSLWHLALNMWTLWVFGNPVNRRIGNGYYLAAYLGSIVVLGLIAKLVLHIGLAGSSGVLFAVITMALVLMPAGVVRTACVGLFPLTIVVGLLSKPKELWQWLVRWTTFSIPALWCLVVIPLIQLWSFFWSGWNWGPAAHLLGMMCGLAAVLLLPTRISMGRRSLAGI